MSRGSLLVRILRGVGITLGVAVLLLGALFLRALRPPDSPVTTVEIISPTEQDHFLTMVRKATTVIEHQPGADTLTRRDAHAKPHGCVRATLTVEPDLVPELRHGVFALPAREYLGWVRFSNGTMADDRKPDARGMALKLTGVEGPKILTPQEDPEQDTQDFVMINYPTFFLPTLEDYEGFFDYQAANRPFAWFFASRNPLDWRLREFLIGGKTLYQKVPSPLATRYYSMSAYRLGPHNVKFTARPCEPRDRPMPRGRGPDFLREALVADLASADACFRLMVQLQDPTRFMPIEDPSVEWKESDSPFRTVATIRIPAQDFATPEQDRFCENLQFAPFHSLEEHRPLGRMNRVRQMVYREVSLRRHSRNDAPRAGPRGWCLDLSGESCPAEEEP